MIFSWIFIFALAIFHFIQFKKARRLRRYITFRRISFMILFCELVLLILPFLTGKYL
ncbi:Ribosomal RNA small subunit methyltransferase E [Campylobacter coli IPSID-1]|nr:Ribosomal RNA small subunit methyltransferase E [Campylobacter coli IPSID-1]